MSNFADFAAPSGALILAPGLAACAADGQSPLRRDAPVQRPEPVAVEPAPNPAAVAGWHRRLARAFLLCGSSALALTVALGTRALLEGE